MHEHEYPEYSLYVTDIQRFGRAAIPSYSGPGEKSTTNLKVERYNRRIDNKITRCKFIKHNHGELVQNGYITFKKKQATLTRAPLDGRCHPRDDLERSTRKAKCVKTLQGSPNVQPHTDCVVTGDLQSEILSETERN